MKRPDNDRNPIMSLRPSGFLWQGGIAPLGYVENSILHANQLNYVCAKTVIDSTKLRLMKGPKSFLGGLCPQTPLFATCFAHGFVLPLQ